MCAGASEMGNGTSGMGGGMTKLVERTLGCTVGVCGVALDFMVGERVGTNIGARDSEQTVWTWGALVGVT